MEIIKINNVIVIKDSKIRININKILLIIIFNKNKQQKQRITKYL